MLCTSENGIETNVEVITTVREKYPSIHITAAVSNISFNLPVRKMINLGFTVLAMNAGLDSAILDPTNRGHDGRDLRHRSSAGSGRLLHGVHRRLS